MEKRQAHGAFDSRRHLSALLVCRLWMRAAWYVSPSLEPSDLGNHEPTNIQQDGVDASVTKSPLPYPL